MFFKPKTATFYAISFFINSLFTAIMAPDDSIRGISYVLKSWLGINQTVLKPFEYLQKFLQTNLSSKLKNWLNKKDACFSSQKQLHFMRFRFSSIHFSRPSWHPMIPFVGYHTTSKTCSESIKSFQSHQNMYKNFCKPI